MTTPRNSPRNNTDDRWQGQQAMYRDDRDVASDEDEHHAFLAGEPRVRLTHPKQVQQWRWHWRWLVVRRWTPHILGTAIVLLLVISLCSLTAYWSYGSYAARRETLRDMLGTKARYPTPTSLDSDDVHPPVVDAHNCSTVPLPGDVPPHCELVHLQLVSRHGTRNPTPRVVEKLAALETELLAHHNSAWPKWLVSWRNPYSMDTAAELVEQGKHDLASLATRDVCRYGRWLDAARFKDPSDPRRGSAASERHQLAWYGSSAKQRCIDSAKAYATVFSGQKLDTSAIHILPELALPMDTAEQGQDNELAMHHACALWEKQSKDRSGELSMEAPYRERYMPMILDQLSETLGYPTTNETLEAVWMACAFEFAIDAKPNQWCQLVQSHTKSVQNLGDSWWMGDNSEAGMSPLRLVDFFEDVRHYFQYGPGHPLNQRLACVLFTRVLGEMRTALRGQPGPRWWLRFAHAETIMLMLNHLDVYTGPLEFRQDRAFRTSRIAPFAANLHFELLRCGSETASAVSRVSDDNYHVRVLLNEQPIRIPGCPADQDLCPWAEFERAVLARAGDCHFDAMCRLPKL
ncbi:histidine phosphatase superfamily [Thamnocephalis sphaerospora]|uniref:Multiple inositol polyphosphate phosphatase 1 n=1 Tax=Thamnocephalis sphaerospora TaxID=78915 RepID=A0A4P9XX20_9FUNG|nr:histidine phosphatase superfamily [Thamnocephalis sphaerospora]|eukprot:RKP10854.1 histidine phosphatase superfamily [Thamnocephalis sphaerospora]